jgi:actin beta/gamma 1
MVESEQIIVIDNGSDTIKAGFAGEEHPRAVFSSVVGRPKYDSFMHGTTQKSEYFGEEAMDKRGILNLSYPISAGIVESWEDMEKVWHQTFYYELLAEPAEAVGVILTETPLNPKQNRERMTEIMFDYFQAKNVYIALQGYMSLYATGRTTGLVCEIGDGVTHTTPVHEGYSIHNAINKTEIAGRFVTI